MIMTTFNGIAVHVAREFRRVAPSSGPGAFLPMTYYADDQGRMWCLSANAQGSPVLYGSPRNLARTMQDVYKGILVEVEPCLP